MGVIIIELLENNPPFEPDSEIRGLHLIFMTLGTPDCESWEDYEHHKHYSELFPKWTPKLWSQIMPNSPPEMIDLVKVFTLSVVIFSCAAM